MCCVEKPIRAAQPCKYCKGSGEVGILGPPGLGLWTNPCVACSQQEFVSTLSTTVADPDETLWASKWSEALRKAAGIELATAVAANDKSTSEELEPATAAHSPRARYQAHISAEELWAQSGLGDRLAPTPASVTATSEQTHTVTHKHLEEGKLSIGPTGDGRMTADFSYDVAGGSPQAARQGDSRVTHLARLWSASVGRLWSNDGVNNVRQSQNVCVYPSHQGKQQEQSLQHLTEEQGEEQGQKLHLQHHPHQQRQQQLQQPAGDQHGSCMLGDGPKYNGPVQGNVPHGVGRQEWLDGTRYEGHYRNGQKHGIGHMTWANGSDYDGEFAEGNISGVGRFRWSDGSSYEGGWQNHKMHGRGEFVWPDGRSYEGDYCEDKRNGHGIFKWPDGRRFEGQWKHGRQHGIGIYSTAHGRTRTGHWNEGGLVRWMAATTPEPE